MIQQEFEVRTGMQVTPDEYEEIERVYLAAGNMDKDTFCHDWKNHSDSVIMRAFYDQAVAMQEKIEELTDERVAMVDWLLKTADEIGNPELHYKAVYMSGRHYVIMRTIQLGLALTDEDKAWIASYLESQLRGMNPARL